MTRHPPPLAILLGLGGLAQGAILQHLRVGDADTKLRRRLPHRATVEKTQLEDASVLLRQSGQDGGDAVRDLR